MTRAGFFNSSAILNTEWIILKSELLKAITEVLAASAIFRISLTLTSAIVYSS